jgi:hypothetical protein
MTEPLTFRLRNMFACACKEPAEAADRIEKLEAALREITESARLVGDYYHVKIARKALEKNNGE